jgi:hypothetical protein
VIPFALGGVLLHALISAPPQPFAVGEVLQYSGRWSGLPFDVGGATLSVVDIDTTLGTPTWHFKLTTEVSTFVYKNKTTLESWTGVHDFVSRRFVHLIHENGKQLADDDFHIHGDSGYYRNHRDTLTRPTPKQPLDDLAFMYFIRGMDLKVGTTVQIPRYFRQDHNPVEVTVLGIETLQLPNGYRTRCLVIHPVVDEPNGLFSRKADAKLWLTDDGLRIPVQIHSSVGVGSVTLKLKQIGNTGTPAQ